MIFCGSYDGELTAQALAERLQRVEMALHDKPHDQVHLLTAMT